MGLTSVIDLDSLETTVNSTLMSVPVSQVSMEICVWMEETTAETRQILDPQGHTVRP